MKRNNENSTTCLVDIVPVDDDDDGAMVVFVDDTDDSPGLFLTDRLFMNLLLHLTGVGAIRRRPILLLVVVAAAENEGELVFTLSFMAEVQRSARSTLPFTLPRTSTHSLEHAHTDQTHTPNPFRFDGWMCGCCNPSPSSCKQ